MTEEEDRADDWVLVCFIFILCGLIGAVLGYAHWSHTITLEGEVSDIYSYNTHGPGLKDHSGEVWIIYLSDDTKDFKAHANTEPYRIRIGDHVVAECFDNRDNLAKRITVNGSEVMNE